MRWLNINNKNYVILYRKFAEIRKLGWVKSLSKSPTSIGQTFEKLIGKKSDNLPIADFLDIEIKVKKKNTYTVCLFSINPDINFSIKDFYDKYGIVDKKNFKTIYLNINSLSKINLGNFLFSVKIDKTNQQIRLLIYDYDNNLISNNIAWSFDIIKERINLKIDKLAIVYAESKMKQFAYYFRYYYIKFYKFKSFDQFLKLVDEGLIHVSFNISAQKNGNIYNHGICFYISLYNIGKLYDIIEIKKD